MEKYFAFLISMLISINLYACNITQQAITATSTDGKHVLKGFSVAQAPQGYFFAKDNELTCFGLYDATTQSIRISTSVSCTNGSFGTATIIRDANLCAARGEATLNDGSRYTIAFD